MKNSHFSSSNQTSNNSHLENQDAIISGMPQASAAKTQPQFQAPVAQAGVSSMQPMQPMQPQYGQVQPQFPAQPAQPAQALFGQHIPAMQPEQPQYTQQSGQQIPPVQQQHQQQQHYQQQHYQQQHYQQQYAQQSGQQIPPVQQQHYQQAQNFVAPEQRSFFVSATGVWLIVSGMFSAFILGLAGIILGVASSAGTQIDTTQNPGSSTPLLLFYFVAGVFSIYVGFKLFQRQRAALKLSSISIGTSIASYCVSMVLQNFNTATIILSIPMILLYTFLYFGLQKDAVVRECCK